jgi:hypothetical protein
MFKSLFDPGTLSDLASFLCKLDCSGLSDSLGGASDNGSLAIHATHDEVMEINMINRQRLNLNRAEFVE